MIKLDRNYKVLYMSDDIKWTTVQKVADTLIAAMSFVSCKDYLIDCLHNRVMTFNRYFPTKTSHPSKHPSELAIDVNTNKTTQLLINIPSWCVKNIKLMVKELNAIEKRYRWKRTTCTKVEEFYFIESSKKWTSNTVLASLYYSYIRALLTYGIPLEQLETQIRHEKAGPYTSNEHGYILGMPQGFFTHILRNIKKFDIKVPFCHGYQTDNYAGHGTSGIFFLTQYRDNDTTLNNKFRPIIHSLLKCLTSSNTNNAQSVQS